MARAALERLSQRDKELCGLDAWRRVEIMSDIDSDRAYRGRVTKPTTNTVGVLPKEIVEPDAIVNIAAVVENYSSQDRKSVV